MWDCLPHSFVSFHWFRYVCGDVTSCDVSVRFAGYKSQCFLVFPSEENKESWFFLLCALSPCEGASLTDFVTSKCIVFYSSILKKRIRNNLLHEKHQSKKNASQGYIQRCLAH